jgi:hypothetical protein
MDSLERGFDRLVEVTFEWLPQLLGALLIILIGHWIARVVSSMVSRALNGVRLDDRLYSSKGGTLIERAVPSPTSLISKITYWLLLLGAVSLGATVLGIEALTNLVNAIYGFIPQAIVAIIIFLVGSAIAAGVATLVHNTMGDTPTGKLVESIAPVIVIGLTIFMILDQLNVAPAIVTITYAALVGSVALASALAFGLGGRDVAAHLLDGAVAKGKENAGQVKHDAAVAKSRTEEKINQRTNKR